SHIRPKGAPTQPSNRPEDPVDPPTGVHASLGLLLGFHEKPFDRTAVKEVLLDDLAHVFHAGHRIPDLLGTDDHGGAAGALVETPGRVGADSTPKAHLVDEALELGANRLRALGRARALGILGIAAVRADEDVTLEVRHREANLAWPGR